MRKDYIPVRDADFDRWLTNLTDYVSVKTYPQGGQPAQWTHIPAQDVQTLSAHEVDFHMRWKVLAGPHTHGDVVAKNTARVAAEEFARYMVQRYLQWAPVTDEDRANMEITIRDREPTEQPVPTTTLDIDFVLSVTRRLTVRYRDKGAESWGKPEYIHSAQFRYCLRSPGEPRPVDIEELNIVLDSSHSPFVLDFDEDQRGMRVYVVGRWMNNTKGYGPWSDIESAFIP